jgi:hypothetical protein
LAQRRAAAAEVMLRVGYATAPRPSAPPRTNVTPEEVQEMHQHLAAKGLA